VAKSGGLGTVLKIWQSPAMHFRICAV